MNTKLVLIVAAVAVALYFVFGRSSSGAFGTGGQPFNRTALPRPGGSQQGGIANLENAITNLGSVFKTAFTNPTGLGGGAGQTPQQAQTIYDAEYYQGDAGSGIGFPALGVVPASASGFPNQGPAAPGPTIVAPPVDIISADNGVPSGNTLAFLGTSWDSGPPAPPPNLSADSFDFSASL